ncbi:MAG: ATP-dependent metallopeptidase FtsH/Yme1/Tma family protein, partial [Terriglobales bacterium]
MSAILLWQLVVRAGGAGLPESEIDFSAFLNHVDQGNVKDVTITGTDVRGTYKDGTALFRTTVPPNYPDMITLLRQKGVTIKVKDNQGGSWSGWLLGLAPVLLVLGLWIFMLRQMQMGGNKALSFGKSRARLLSMQQKKVTFKDVAGADEAKEELKEIIEFLREAQK